MVPLSALWIPTLLSAVLVFVASNVLWMMLPFWHRRDYAKLPDEAGVLRALDTTSSGMYIAPCADWKKQTAEERASMMQGPMAMLLLRNPASTFSFPVSLASYFAYTLVISILVAYLAGRALPPNADFTSVFRMTSVAGVLGYAFGGIPYAIWYGKPMAATVRDVVDGVIFGLLIGASFGWLWPH